MFQAQFASTDERMEASFSAPSGSMDAGFEGTTEKINLENDYDKLKNIPSINDVELRGNMDAEMLGLQETIRVGTIKDIERLFYGG